MTKEGRVVKEGSAGTAGVGAAARAAGTGAPGDEDVSREAGADTPIGEGAVPEAATGAAGDEAAGGKDGAGASSASDDGNAARELGGPDGKDAAADTGGAGTDGAQARSAASEAPAGSLDDALAEARRAAQENLDRALRAQAEVENVRRRAERDLAHAHKFALERFVSELLPVKDSLELGLAASAEKGATTASIAEGVELTLRMFEQAMEKFGIESIDPAGDPFNPEFHQAMTMQESDTAESGTVLTVVQKGYLLNERLVRPAMVIVAK